MNENQWSPFDPKWYELAFDKYTSTSDELFNKDLVIQAGFEIPDADGSKSSVFRNNAVLNNSFNEKAVRESLKDIYLNSSHKLVASNHDNVHFYKWHGSMSDMTLLKNEGMCEFVIPTDSFIHAKERDKFKMSQFYRKWIKVEDILNNWDAFKWHCLLFINRRIYSEYELRIDDHQVTIRFKYDSYWVQHNYPVYIYKFDTSVQHRSLISRYLCETEWNWKMPVSYLNDPRFSNCDRVMVAINKISDQDIRSDGLTKIEVLGDNLEFLEVKDGYIDLTKISNFNKIYILSEMTEWLWMSVIVPKFFHEYPIYLPMEHIYRPYEANFEKVVTMDQGRLQHVNATDKDGNQQQVYVDSKGGIFDNTAGWREIIRPIVLSDAFNNTYIEPLTSLTEYVTKINTLTANAAEIVDNFRTFMGGLIDNEIFNKYLDDITNAVNDITITYRELLDKQFTEYDPDYESTYVQFMSMVDTVRSEGPESYWFTSYHTARNNFWITVSPLISIPLEMVSKFNVATAIQRLEKGRVRWDTSDDYQNKMRFQRPIDESDFWTFEYDINDNVWRPYHLDVTRHFPDVYILNDPEEPICDAESITDERIESYVHQSFNNTIKDERYPDDQRPETSIPLDNVIDDTDNAFTAMGNIITPDSSTKGAITTKSVNNIVDYNFEMNVYGESDIVIPKHVEEEVPPYRIFKSFFFYSDTMNNRNESTDIIHPTTTWDEDVQEYHIDQEATYRDIFMEKFYWMGIRSIYKGLLATECKWEVIEYIIDNDSYTRFNELFLNTMDPYFKLGLATYMRGSNFEFPFDDAIDKLKEATSIDWIGYKKITNFEIYLNKSWIPSYFDHIVKVMDDWNYEKRLLKRPGDSFYVIRLIPMIQEVQAGVYDEMYSVVNDLSNIINDLSTESYGLNMDKIELLRNISTETYDIICNIIDYTNNLDLEIYSNNDINTMINMFKEYLDHNESISIYFNDIHDNVNRRNVYADKLNSLSVISDQISIISNRIDEVAAMAHGFDIDEFMKSTNDLRTYDDPNNDDNSLLGFINRFADSWPKNVQGLRDDLYASTILLNSIYNTESSYTNEEFIEFVNTINNVKNNLDNLRSAITTYWDDNQRAYDQSIVDRFDNSEHLVSVLLDNINGYLSTRDNLISDLNNIELYLNDMTGAYIGNDEVECMESIKNDISTIIEALSYINGGNKYIAHDAASDIRIWLSKWSEYCNREGEIFERLIEITKPPVGFVNTLDSYKGIINSMVEYMDTVNEKYIPNTSVPTYSDVFTVDAVKIMNGGFRNKSREIVFVPNLGSYKIDSVDETGTTLSLSDRHYRNTTFKNPMTQSNPFDSITNGTGLGIRVKPVESSCIHIIDDRPVEHILDRIQNVIYMIRTDIFDSDSVDNYEQNMKSLEDIKSDWDHLLGIYRDHISDGVISSMTDIIDDVNTLINASFDEVEPTMQQLESNVSLIRDILQHDEWYRIDNISVALEGSGYQNGDIIEIIPKLPTDPYGEEIHDMEDIIMADVILMQISEIKDGIVTEIIPLMDYALPYQIWGVRETITRTGSGTGLTVDVMSHIVDETDNILFNDKDSDEPFVDIFNENDMFVFKFENIYDIDINYEIFIGGKQIGDFYQRHETVDNPLYPKEIDAIYINANKVMQLRNAAISTPAEHYEIYKLDSVDIKDPGAGYAVGQDIFIGTDQANVKLKVSKLTDDPYKGIEEVKLSDGVVYYDKFNPASTDAEVITDSLNNMDDEFNVGYYDNIPPDGILKAATLSLDEHLYPFTSKRFDNLEDGDRNKTFIYPNVDMPEGDDIAINGDPDGGWYLGNRIDNSQHPMTDYHIWNGVMNVVPVTHPFIPDNQRIPTGQPIKGEYQLINRVRILNSDGICAARCTSIDNVEQIVRRSFNSPVYEGRYDNDVRPPSSIPLNNILDDTDNAFERRDDDVKIEYNYVEGSITGELVDYYVNYHFETGMSGHSELVRPADVDDWFNFRLINAAMIDPGSIHVLNFVDLPMHINEFPNAAIGKSVIVEHDEMHDGHRMLYRIRTFIASGHLIYDEPEIADMKWNTIDIDFMNCDSYPDFPALNAIYKTAPWDTADTFKSIQRGINDGIYEPEFNSINVNTTTYIRHITIDDISVYNWTTKEWEDLSDSSRWDFTGRNDDEGRSWGFTLNFREEGNYFYDMAIYLNKVPDNQLRNAKLKKNAVMDISTSISSEVIKEKINSFINTGHHLRIRKLFPYHQKQSFVIGTDTDGGSLGQEMNFVVAPYMHFRNELHLEDIKIYNKSAGRFEDIMDTTMFEVRFKNDKAVTRGYETNTSIASSVIARAGESFTNDYVWGWNAQFGIHIFGYVTADFMGDGHIITFTPTHCPNPPSEDITIEFQLFQRRDQDSSQSAAVLVSFKTEKVEMFGDGYIHNVTNRYAPIPKEFKVIVRYRLDEPSEYEIILDKTPRKYVFIEPSWLMSPTFHIPDYNVQQNRVYLLTDKGRFPLINPSTGKPTFNVTETDSGTDVQFLNLYRRYEHLEVHAVPYPMRSVYVQRRVPSHGYIDLAGKINKPLNKKYFEFWMNGRLLHDEVTIITPTKIFLHGLQSLRNFEIIEVNRDPNEYFSDNFIDTSKEPWERTYQTWNFRTYLDDALEGTLDGDNYTLEEQECLLSPVWKQVEQDHPEFKNYPPNVDTEDDILLRINVEDYPIGEVEDPLYQCFIIDQPTLEGHPLSDRHLTFSGLGFKPMTAEMIVAILNEEWADEIQNDPYFPKHEVITDEDWYGTVTRMYNEYGMLVHNLNDAAYHIADTNLLRINTDTKSNDIMENHVTYNLD